MIFSSILIVILTLTQKSYTNSELIDVSTDSLNFIENSDNDLAAKFLSNNNDEIIVIPTERENPDNPNDIIDEPLSSINIDYKNHAVILSFRRNLPHHRPALDKNFMRFGRSGSPVSDNRMRFGKRQIELYKDQRALNSNEVGERYERSNSRGARGDSFMRLGRTNPNLMRFGRSASNLMRFGRAANDGSNLMRFGRANENLMRFGRANENLMRFGRPDSFMRFGRSDGNLMRFGRANDGSLMRFGRSNLMRFGRSKDGSLMRFGRNDGNFMRFGKIDQNFMRFGKRSNEENTKLNKTYINETNHYVTTPESDKNNLETLFKSNDMENSSSQEEQDGYNSGSLEYLPESQLTSFE